MREPQVLVVGAGPAGLVTAITLARLGVSVLIVERRAELSPFPRATGISLRSMELLRSWGLEDRIRDGAMDVGTLSWTTETLAAPTGFASSLGFPSPEQARAVSPTTPVAAPQDHLEPVLLQHLRTYPGVRVEFGTELLGVVQERTGIGATNGATATLRLRGDTRHLRVEYVVGADGAHSTVRAAAGIEMIGPDDLGAYLAVLFRARLREVLAARGYALYLLRQPQGPPMVLLPTDNRDRWMFSTPWDPAVGTLADYPHVRLVKMIREATGVTDLDPRILRVGVFTFAAQIAERYREGRLFLVGDAAHRMTPRGGTGMNTAIHDGFDLGWKLAWVLRGWAAPSLLDTYERRRRPVGLRNVERSAVEGSTRDASMDYLDDLGGRITHATLPDGRSTLDLVGPGLTLLTGPRGRRFAEATAVLGGCVPVAVHGTDEATAAELGIGPDGAVLVLPDATPVRRWPTAPSDVDDELALIISGQTDRTSALV